MRRCNTRCLQPSHPSGTTNFPASWDITYDGRLVRCSGAQCGHPGPCWCPGFRAVNTGCSRTGPGLRVRCVAISCGPGLSRASFLGNPHEASFNWSADVLKFRLLSPIPDLLSQNLGGAGSGISVTSTQPTQAQNSDLDYAPAGSWTDLGSVCSSITTPWGSSPGALRSPPVHARAHQWEACAR